MRLNVDCGLWCRNSPGTSLNGTDGLFCGSLNDSNVASVPGAQLAPSRTCLAEDNSPIWTRAFLHPLLSPGLRCLVTALFAHRQELHPMTSVEPIETVGVWIAGSNHHVVLCNTIRGQRTSTLELMIIGISMGHETCLIFGRVSHNLL